VAAYFESLRKILELEHKKEYDNSAVIGGLDRFLGSCVDQTAEAIPDRRLLQRFQRLVARVNYASLSSPQRRDGRRTSSV